MPHLRAGAGRVRARRGRAPLGRRGQGVPRLPRRDLGPLRRPLPSARSSRRSREQAGDARCTSRTSSTPSRRCALARAARRESSLGGRVFLCNSGAEANECAIKLARKHAHGRGIERARDRRARGRLPRPHATARSRRRPELARDDLFGAAACRASSPVPRDDPDGAARRGRRAHRGGDDRADPGRGRRLPDRRRAAAAAREACDDAGALLDLRRDPDRDGADRLALGLRADCRVRPDVMTAAKALGGGLPVGACVTGAGARRGARARRPRLDLRRRPASPAPRRLPRSRSSTTRRCCAACASWARGFATTCLPSTGCARFAAAA